MDCWGAGVCAKIAEKQKAETAAKDKSLARTEIPTVTASQHEVIEQNA